MMVSNDHVFHRLMKALGAPEHLTKFELLAQVNDVVRITCEYLPSLDLDENGELLREIAEFELVRRDRKRELKVEAVLDLGLMPYQLQAISDTMLAKTRAEADIAIRALRALCEIQEMTDLSREDLGLPTRERIEVRVKVT